MKVLKIILLVIFVFPFFLYAADSDIRLNSLGFLPLLEKRASIVSSCADFDVKRASDDSVAYSGTAFYWGTNSDTSEEIYIADFTPLCESGTFYLDVPGVGTSYNFEIGYDIYKSHFYTAARAFYLWRCGMAVTGTHEGETFHHDACHLDDAYLDYVGAVM